MNTDIFPVRGLESNPARLKRYDAVICKIEEPTILELQIESITKTGGL
jgi:hypothetical protein